MSGRNTPLRTDGRQMTKEGWLMKEGGAPRTKWQNRWFRLQGKTVNYFIKREDASPQGVIHLEEVKDISKIGERSGKPHCMAIVTTRDKSKKVYYLASETEDVLNEWFVSFNANLAPDIPVKLLKYSTAEVFLSSGVRITGDVNYEILSFISHRVPVEKKKRDNFGWFCDRPIAVGAVLNLFSDYGWSPERIFRSTAVSGTEATTIVPVVRILFSKSPGGPMCKSRTASKSQSSPPHSSPLLNSNRSEKFLGAIRGAAGKLSSFTRSDDSPPLSASSPLPPEAALLEGADDELISLMQEFDIPLSLLEVPAE